MARAKFLNVKDPAKDKALHHLSTHFSERQWPPMLFDVAVCFTCHESWVRNVADTSSFHVLPDWHPAAAAECSRKVQQQHKDEGAYRHDLVNLKTVDHKTAQAVNNDQTPGICSSRSDMIFGKP